MRWLAMPLLLTALCSCRPPQPVQPLPELPPPYKPNLQPLHLPGLRARVVDVRTSRGAGMTESQIQGGVAQLQAGNVDGIAAVFSNDVTKPRRLQAPGYMTVIGFSTDGKQVGGFGYPGRQWPDRERDPYHALFWADLYQPPVDLHPKGWHSSEVRGVEGDVQVGWVTDKPHGLTHPMLWRGSAESATDLLPAGARSGRVFAVHDGVQVGSVRFRGSDETHGGTWRGTPESFVDLNPAGYRRSAIIGISDSDMVGNASPIGEKGAHAVRWTSSGIIDLHPPGKYSSNVNVSNGRIQVGSYMSSATGEEKACMWAGTPESFVDLSASLPKGPDYSLSEANTIVGDTIYGFAQPPGSCDVVAWKFKLSVGM